MTLEFKKDKDRCILSTENVKNPVYPLWLTKENFEEIKTLMGW